MHAKIFPLTAPCKRFHKREVGHDGTINLRWARLPITFGLLPMQLDDLLYRPTLVAPCCNVCNPN